MKLSSASREKIPTPYIAMIHKHLTEIADILSPQDPDYEIMLLIGRDMLIAHHDLYQVVGTLGRVVVGNMC